MELEGNYKVDPATGCWNWQRSMKPAGYGELWKDGVRHYAHRLSWAERNGPIPDGMFVCHKCDNRACCNPDHLFIGTHSDNMRDMYSKGRMPEGNWEAAAQARRKPQWLKNSAMFLYKAGMTKSDVQRATGVSRSGIAKWEQEHGDE